MSHNPERKEKNCLNCGAEVQGRFCQVCGQENIETRESFWSLAKHFIFDIIHFDGKFLYTLKYIFTRPGYVARQYAEGRRASYLHPIRMYLFTSAVFFLVLFSTRTAEVNLDEPSGSMTTKERVKKAVSYQRKLKNLPSDSVYKKRIALLLDTVHSPSLNLDSLGWNEGQTISFSGNSYHSLAEYDSLQALLPAKEKDGWFNRKLTTQFIKVNKKYQGTQGAAAFLEGFLHKMPYILFVSLPFFAAILKLLYIRRKNFYYSDHVIFTLYHYVFSFLLLLVMFGVSALHSWLEWKLLNWLIVALAIFWAVYLFKEMRRFYLQGRGKTFFKFLLLNVTGFFLVLILFVLFLFLSIFQA